MYRPLLALALVLAADARREARTVERRFSSELELVTQTFELISGDEKNPVTKQGPLYLREQAEEIELVDTLADGTEPPTTFTRLYRGVMSSSRMGTETAPRERTASAGLEGKTVLFERDEDGEWTKSSDDPGTRPVQLKNLRTELDLAAFLPGPESEARAPGDAWTIPAATFARLVSPLQEGWRRPRQAPKPEAGALNLAPSALSEPIGALLAAAEGELAFTWVEPGAPGQDDEDDPLPNHARFEFELESAFDGSERLLGGVGGEGQAEDDVQLTYAGSGTLAWDPGSGVFEIACQGELRLSEDFRITVEAEGTQGEMRGALVLSGTLALEGREERGE